MTAITLIRAGRNLEQTENMLRDGRVSQREFDKYWDAWCWSAPRLSGVPGGLQAAYEHKHGWSGLHERIARVRRIVLRIAQGS